MQNVAKTAFFCSRRWNQLKLCSSKVQSNAFSFQLQRNAATSVQTHPSEDTLLKTLVQRIQIGGPISVYEYMKSVLTWPDKGFYMNQDVFGKKGHFITSPEISQIFGELLAVWILYEWRRVSNSKKLNLIEFGPGRGTLMSDICRIINKFPESKGNVSISFVEVSPALRKLQKDQFKKDDGKSKYDIPIEWYQDVSEIPMQNDAFNVFLAHEFFDALPIHKFKRDSEGNWREILIDLDVSGSMKALNSVNLIESIDTIKLRYVLSRHSTPASKALIPKDLDGVDFEFCPEAVRLLDKITKHLNASSGVFLLCDYGFSKELNQIDGELNRDTFRSFKNHQQWNPLVEPGSADLTADVDFDLITKLASKRSVCFGPVTQQQFLMQLGAHIRLSQLLRHASDESTRRQLLSGMKMLLEDMGKRFKFVALFPQHTKQLFDKNPPAGFVTNQSNRQTS